MRSRPHHLRPPFKPYVRISRIRLPDGLLTWHAHLLDSVPPPRLSQDVTPPDPVVQRVEATLPVALGRRVEPALEFSHFVFGVVGSDDHALALTPLRRRDQSRAPSLGRGFPRRHQYYGPLGLPPGLTPFHHQLIRVASAGRRPPGRVSPVPHRAVSACPPPYPEGVLHRSGSRCSLLPSLRHEQLGQPSLSGRYLTRLQGSLHAGPADLLPTQEPYGPPWALDTPLRRGDLSPRPGSATRRSGAYRGGTLTRKSDAAGTAPRLPGTGSVRTHRDMIVRSRERRDGTSEAGPPSVAAERRRAACPLCRSQRMGALTPAPAE
jgi:hypothetical protein